MTECMAEWCAAHVLRYHLDLDEYIKPEKNEWKSYSTERLLANQVNVGILGLGILGTATANKLRKLDFNVTGWSTTEKNLSGIKSLVGANGLAKILADSDYLILLLPLTRKQKILSIQAPLKWSRTEQY